MAVVSLKRTSNEQHCPRYVMWGVDTRAGQRWLMIEAYYSNLMRKREMAPTSFLESWEKRKEKEWIGDWKRSDMKVKEEVKCVHDMIRRVR